MLSVSDWVQEYADERQLDVAQFMAAAQYVTEQWPATCYLSLCPGDATVYRILFSPAPRTWCSPGQYPGVQDEVIVALGGFGTSYQWRPRPLHPSDGMHWVHEMRFGVTDHVAYIIAAFLDTTYNALVDRGLVGG